MSRSSFLLHVCCAPCSTRVVELLSREYELTGFFCNPNIHPRREYRLRLAEARRYFGEKSIGIIVPPYRPREWFAAVKGRGTAPEGGERCAACIRTRLEETARAAAARGFTDFGTTLSISPHKDAGLINRLGAEAGGRHGLRFHAADFKKGDGYRKSCELSRRHSLYRQNYCGCIYSYLARGNPKNSAPFGR